MSKHGYEPLWRGTEWQGVRSLDATSHGHRRARIEARVLDALSGRSLVDCWETAGPCQVCGEVAADPDSDPKGATNLVWGELVCGQCTPEKLEETPAEWAAQRLRGHRFRYCEVCLLRTARRPRNLINERWVCDSCRIRIERHDFPLLERILWEARRVHYLDACEPDLRQGQAPPTNSPGARDAARLRSSDRPQQTSDGRLPMNSNHAIDLQFRPESYFQPMEGSEGLLTRVKGAARRSQLRQLLDEGPVEEIPEFLTRPALSESEREQLGAIHPMLMGGEYLPDQEPQEVEIARIEIASTTGDVTCVYARPVGQRIHYRVVDEYGGETLTGESELESDGPLSLCELEEFFLGAWDLMEDLEMNFECDRSSMLGFFRASSLFYPMLDDLLRWRVAEEFRAEDPEEIDRPPV